MMTNLLHGAHVANKLFSTIARLRLLLVMFLTLTVSAEVWGADVTVKWTASSGALGSNIGSGTIKTGTFSWDYTRTLKSGSTYTGWTSNCIQLGKNGGVENITFTTSAIPGTIKSVSVECSSYNNAHKVSIKVGNNTYLSSTATAKWTTISTKTGSGTSSGQIVISFTDGSRALYIKSISVTYEEAAATVPVTGVSLNKSSLTLTEGDSETLTATVSPNNATDKTITWSTSNSSFATVSDGKVTAVAEGSATITVTTTDGGKTATCNVTVNPKPKYTVTWNVNGEVYETTQVTEGSKPTFPATPNSCDATSTTFYGWATATWDGKINDINGKIIYTSADEMPEVNGAVTYYSVFAKEGTSGSGTAGWSKVTSTDDLEAGATYAISSAATGGNYLSTYTGANNFPYSTTTICKLVLGGSEGAWTFKINDASTYNNYYLTATSTTGSNYLKATSTIDNYCKFSISFENTGNAVITCTGKSSRNILRYNSSNNPNIFACYSSGQSAVYLQKYSTGSTATYSDYITQCTKEPTDCSKLQFTTNITENYSATYAQNATANVLTVSAEYDSNSTGVTYQWHSNTTNSNTNGTLITNATSASYKPSTTAVGTTYYYCVATYDECTITSKVATIVVNPTYTVTFDSDGGSTVLQQNIEKGKTATKPTNPTKTGYTFIGWYNGNTEFDFDTPITGNITLKAKWTINQHTVTLNPNYPNGKTGTFKDKGGNTISENLVLTYDYNTASMSLTDLYQSIELEGYQFNGWFSATSGGSKWISTGTITSNVTVYAQWSKLHTVTFNTGTNNPTVDAMEGTSETGITLPAGPTPTCTDWTFAGWWTEEVGATTTSPGELLTAGSNYKPTSDCTLYAVYSHTEAGGGGGSQTVTLTNNEIDAAYVGSGDNQTTSYGNHTIVSASGTWGGLITIGNYSDVKYVGISADNANRHLASPIFSANITNITIRGRHNASNTRNIYICSSNTTAKPTSGDIGKGSIASSGVSGQYTNWTDVSIPVSGDYKNFYVYADGGLQIYSIVVTTSGGSTTTYNSNPVCGSTPTLTVDKTSLAFGSVATDSNKEMTFTLTGSDLTANATLALSGTNESMFSVNPTSVTQSEGSINQTITVTYTPTAAGEHTATLTISSTGAESKTVALSGTGTAPAAKYTVTFDAGSGTCGTESLTETSGGAGVTLPTANPPAACATDGWKFAGWWTEAVAETTTSPGELLTAGSNYKPASDCTLYAVYSYTEAGGGDSDVTFNFSDIATANSWTNGTAYTTVTISPITINAIGGGNNGKYYTSNTSWRMYNGGSLQISTDIGKITSVSSNPSKTFTINDEGTATLSFSATTEFKSITVSYSSTTYNSNPVCVATYSITYDFADGTGSHCSNTSVPQGNTYTICDEAPTKEGYTFQGWSDGTTTHDAGATITPEDDITFTAVWKANTYTVTWNNNDDTDEVTYNHGDALVVPTAPASCDGVKEFVGWTTHSGYYHATIAPDDIFTTKTTPVTATATYYAVFATPPTTGGGSSIETTYDVLTRETTEVASGSTTYASWSGKTTTSNAIYAGNSAGSHDAIQLRSTDNSGIVSTASGGKVTRVEVEWNENTSSDRTLDIYGRNVAYTDASDLYNANTQGTKLGSIAYGTSIDLEIDGTYEYIGLRSNKNAMYLNSITITWSSAGGSSSHTDYTTICQEVTGIAISGSYPTTFVQYDSFSFAGGIVTATFENGATQDVTSLATFSGYNMDEVGVQTVTVTYMGQTAKYEITINQSDRWRLTWNVSGKTNTGASPIYVQKGSAIGTLPVPEVPAACAGKTFMGWTESNIVPSDGKGIVYITEGTVPSKNTTYYAVFATINNFSTQAAIEDIKSGSKVVIVAVASMDASGGAGQAISSRTISITSKGVIGLSGDEVSIFDETINTPHSTCIWTLTKEGGGIVFEQGEKYIRAVDDGYRKLLLETTKDYWTLSPVGGKDKTYHMQSGNTSHYVEWFDHTDSKYAEGERYIGFVPYLEANDNGDFDMQFYVTANADGNADITDYTTGCAEYTITYYGFHGGYSTSCSSDGTIVLPVNSLHTVPNCGDVVKDHTNLGREFLNVWMTQPHGGHTFKPGDTFILTQDTTLYAQWKMETTSDVTTLPTDIEDLAGTDIYVYGGKTLNIQPGTTTINSLTLKGGLQADGSYKMPTVWVPEGATLIRNSNKIYLDLVVNAKNYYPFAVPFATKNDQYLDYLDPVLRGASTYGTHFAIKTYDGTRRAEVGEDRANNWKQLLRHTGGTTSYLEPGVGYIITALTYPDKDTATIRIPMTVPNTWFENGEQAEVGTTVRNTIAVTAHAGAAATEHQRHAGWNFVANPYLTSFAGGNVANDGDLAYINGELIIEGSYEYGGEDVPYVTIPAYDFAYYSQHKLSDVKLSPEWSFFVQVGTGGTMNFTTAGRQQAPAHLAARAAEQPIKMDVDITLSDDNHSDQTGLIICDRFSDAYEIGHDLEKMFGSAYNLSVYTLMADNTPLAFQALAIQNSMQLIPVGYRTPAQGEYTFALNEATSDIELLNEQYEQLILVDYETGALTNMLNNEYTFYSDRTQSNNRFALYAVPRQNTTTDLPNTIGNEEVKKVIYNDHFYILRDGKVFNGAGQIVK